MIFTIYNQKLNLYYSYHLWCGNESSVIQASSPQLNSLSIAPTLLTWIWNNWSC